MMLNMPEGFRPMKGQAIETLDQVCLPACVLPKIDGFRCVIAPDGTALSSTLKPLPNLFLQDYCKRHATYLAGLDCEIVVGNANDINVFDRTSGPIRRADGEPDFMLHAFDDITRCDDAYRLRQLSLSQRVNVARQHGVTRVRQVDKFLSMTHEELERDIQFWVNAGYEGAIIRDLEMPYKFGRSTIREGALLKFKEFIDNEAIVLDYIEEQANNNDATVDARGLTKRSSHATNKTGKGTLGKFLCRGVNGRFKDVEFFVSTGVLTKDEKQELWNVGYKQCMITYTHMKHASMYQKPRHAGFKCFRPIWDFSVTGNDE